MFIQDYTDIQLTYLMNVGHLVLWSVTSVLFAIDGINYGRVYEAAIVEYSDYHTHYKGYGKDHVYLRLSPRYFQYEQLVLIL